MCPGALTFFGKMCSDSAHKEYGVSEDYVYLSSKRASKVPGVRLVLLQSPVYR
jgi:hypothetical protein